MKLRNAEMACLLAISCGVQAVEVVWLDCLEHESAKVPAP